MPAGYIHLCHQCGYEVNTSGPWEYYLDNQGNRQPYGHPIPLTEEAEAQGISGYTAQVYCSTCGKTVEVIWEKWDYPNQFPGPEELKNPPPCCPQCQNADLVLDPVPGVMCPKCQQGNLQGELDYIS